MKFLLRVLGTWFLGLAVVLLVVDGAKTLAASQMVTTSSGELWAGLHATSLLFMQQWIANSLAPSSLGFVTGHLLSTPGWVLTGVLGILFLFIGRRKRRTQFFEPH